MNEDDLGPLAKLRAAVGHFQRNTHGEYTAVDDVILERAGIDNLEEILGQRDEAMPWQLMAHDIERIDWELKTNKVEQVQAIGRVFLPGPKEWSITHSTLVYDKGAVYGLTVLPNHNPSLRWQRKLNMHSRTLHINDRIVWSARDIRILRHYVLRKPINEIAGRVHLSVKGVERVLKQLRTEFEEHMGESLTIPQWLEVMRNMGLIHFLMIEHDWFNPLPVIHRL